MQQQQQTTKIFINTQKLQRVQKLQMNLQEVSIGHLQ
jgi:hypothetical protein